MAFIDLIKNPTEATLYDIKDHVEWAENILKNPDDLVNKVRRKIEDEVMSWSLNGGQVPAFALPTTFKINDMREMNVPKSEKSFAIKLEAFKKQSTTTSGDGKKKTVTNILYGANILPQPQNIVVSYPKSWGGQAGGSAITDLRNGDFGDTGLKMGTDMANQVLGSSRVGTDIKKGKGINHNDRIKILFEDLPFRTFDMSFMLQPKRKEDVKIMIDFIQQLKIASAPDLAYGDAAWRFPDTFRMTYTGGEGNVLFSTLELACTNITVNYTPQGIWSQYKDGTPVAIQVDLAFMEMEHVTKAKLAVEGSTL